MNVKRYFAQSAREALRALKAELGADAIVLSNRAVNGGVEILALPAEAVGAIEATSRAPTRAPAAQPARAVLPNAIAGPEGDDYQVSLSSRAPAAATARQPGRTAPSAVVPMRAFEPPRIETPDFQLRKRGYVEDPVLFGDAFDDPAQGLGLARSEAGAAAPMRRPAPARPQPRRSELSNDTAGRGPAPRAELRQPPRHDPQPMPEAPRAEAFGRGPRGVAPSRTGADAARSEAAGNAGTLRDDDERIASLQQANVQLMGELATIRGMIERQLAGFAWGEARRNAPARATILGELLEAGFSGQFARQLAEAVPDGASLDEARDSVRAALARDLRAMSSDADLIDQGGVYALVGPTGVGKTTTTAKIAARCVVRHGAEKLALITTDGYRIGAQEQLRIYGRILGVPVFPVRDGADLRQTLAELRNKHMVLIDTVGMSQRDRMVAHQAAMLMGAGSVRRLLLLNATCRGDTLDDVIRAYRGPDLAGCIFSKVDEAASLAPVIGAAIGHQLDVFYVANGQRVPEDVHLPNRAYLLHRALRPKAEESAWKMESDEAVLMMAASGAGH
ncbi:MAG TPA: flagellar biosynthesis protein FlhF [Rhodocyclaceae bacterium]|nr:flagellar biosynthesis protein FlhF [Rhodocyclaceae bacterium]